MSEIDLNIGTLYFGNSRARFCMGYRDTAYEAWKCCETICNSLFRINTGKFRVIYQMVGYSIELLFKVFVLWDDYSDKTKKLLQQKYRHNLKKLYNGLNDNRKNILSDEEKK